MNAGGAVLVFTPYCPGSIGEQVVQVPFFHFLRRERPDRTIMAVVPERSGAVIDRLGIVDRLMDYPVRAGVAELSRAARELRGERPVEVFQLRRKSWRAALLVTLATQVRSQGFSHGANRVFQARSIVWDHDAYIAENYARLLGRSVQEFAAATPPARENYVLFIPGGLTAIKRYPIEQYLVVARDLGKERPVRFLLGPDAERERACLSAAGNAVDVHVAPPMDEVARIVRRAALVITNDCGPGHFAHIHDVPRVSVFDRSIEPGPWFFPGKNGRLLRSEAPGEIAGISPDRILACSRELLEAGASS